MLQLAQTGLDRRLIVAPAGQHHPALVENGAPQARAHQLSVDLRELAGLKFGHLFEFRCALRRVGLGLAGALGLLLGLLLAGLEGRSPEGGLGSPNRAFTAFIIATAAIAVGPLALFASRQRLPLLGGGLLFAGVFGWLMPYLAQWGPGGG